MYRLANVAAMAIQKILVMVPLFLLVTTTALFIVRLPFTDAAFAGIATTTTTIFSSRRTFLISSTTTTTTTTFGAGLFFSKKENALDFGPYKDGTVKVPRDGRKNELFSLYYRLYNPDSDETPMVICHGGPSLPSQYLYPLVPILNERPILFFDQLGCGKSDEPKDLSCTVKDLDTVVSTVLGGRSTSFHLYGHSFGGIVAYEYYVASLLLANDDDNNNKSPLHLKSLILSNAPTDLGAANQIYDKLYAKNPFTFWQNHACKVGIPPSLDDALQHTGSDAIWSGMDAIPQYKVSTTPMAMTKAETTTPPPPQALVLSGSRDFAYDVSNEAAWRNVMGETTTMTAMNFDDCAHYIFYENGPAYGAAIDEFIGKV